MSEHQAGSSAADVTVVMPAYNLATMIDTALASIAGQTVVPHAVVVVDDGSTDGTSDRAERWASRLPIEVVRLHPNAGIGLASAAAVARANTAFVAHLDADDAWLPDHLEVMVATHARHGGMVTTQELAWVPGVTMRATPARERTVPPADQQLRAIIDNNFVFAGTLFAKADYERAGGYRDLRNGEDWDLWIRMIRDGVVVHRTDHPTYLYRIRPDSLSYGHRSAEANVEILETVVTEAQSDTERRWARTGLRRRRAALAVAQAIGCGRAGDRRGARQAAARALALRSRVIPALGLLTAPRFASTVRDRRASARVAG
jgi:glycosyltransferase involved in cell wall biosynthesis